MSTLVSLEINNQVRGNSSRADTYGEVRIIKEDFVSNQRYGEKWKLRWYGDDVELLCDNDGVKYFPDGDYIEINITHPGDIRW